MAGKQVCAVHEMAFKTIGDDIAELKKIKGRYQFNGLENIGRRDAAFR